MKSNYLLQKDIEQPENECPGSDGTVEYQSGSTPAPKFLGNKGKYTNTSKDRNCNNKNCFHTLPVTL